ncbi:MAG: hypothetical protein GF334_08095 [Candidatus Altiarchaeales archaeon]|nr:hypothetical protein [Candidatus Altiarchaeales archaeon]
MQYESIEVSASLPVESDDDLEAKWQQICQHVEDKLPPWLYQEFTDTDEELEEKMTSDIKPGQSLVGHSVGEAWPGRYIDAGMLESTGPLTLTIKDVRREMLRTNFGDKKEVAKDVIYFEETDQVRPCGPGAAKQVAAILGTNYGDWIGKQVVAVPVMLANRKKTVRFHLPGKPLSWPDGNIINTGQKKAAPASPQKQQPQIQLTWDGYRRAVGILQNKGVDIETIPGDANDVQLKFAVSEAIQMVEIAYGNVQTGVLRPQALRYLLQKDSKELKSPGDIDQRMSQVIAAKMVELLGVTEADNVEEATDAKYKAEVAYHHILNWIFATSSATGLTQAEGTVLTRRILEEPKKGFASPIKAIAQQEFTLLKRYLESTGFIDYSKVEEDAPAAPISDDDEIPF